MTDRPESLRCVFGPCDGQLVLADDVRGNGCAIVPVSVAVERGSLDDPWCSRVEIYRTMWIRCRPDHDSVAVLVPADKPRTPLEVLRQLLAGYREGEQ